MPPNHLILCWPLLLTPGLSSDFFHRLQKTQSLFLFRGDKGDIIKNIIVGAFGSHIEGNEKARHGLELFATRGTDDSFAPGMTTLTQITPF